MNTTTVEYLLHRRQAQLYLESRLNERRACLLSRWKHAMWDGSRWESSLSEFISNCRRPRISSSQILDLFWKTILSKKLPQNQLYLWPRWTQRRKRVSCSVWKRGEPDQRLRTPREGTAGTTGGIQTAKRGHLAESREVFMRHPTGREGRNDI